jgi:hypothetical protein
LKSTDVSEDHAVFLFKADETAKARTAASKTMLGVLFNHEDGGDMFLRNVG